MAEKYNHLNKKYNYFKDVLKNDSFTVFMISVLNLVIFINIDER